MSVVASVRALLVVLVLVLLAFSVGKVAAYEVIVLDRGAQGAFFGRSVAIADVNGDGMAELIIGNPGETVDGTPSQGRVYVFDGRGQTILRSLTVPDPASCNAVLGCGFGYSVSAADVNGDGAADIVVGAPYENVGATLTQGRVFVFDGRTGTLILSLDKPNPPSLAAAFGSALAIGDVNGDGRAEIIVGAPQDVVGGPIVAGRVYVFNGETGGLIRALDTPNPEGGGRFGASLASGDVNGDRCDDVLVGAPGEGTSDEGRAYVFDGSNGALIYTLSSPTATCTSGWPMCDFGSSVAAGDLNRDGRMDIIVGSDLEDLDVPDQGAVYVYDGASGGLLIKLTTPSPNLACTQDPGDPNQTPRECNRFGGAVRTGDVNCDGTVDIVVGANAEPLPGAPPSYHIGSVYVFDGLTRTLLLTLKPPAPPQPGEVLFGGALAVGDVDMDGRSDLLVGAFRQNVVPPPPNDQGRAYLLTNLIVDACKPATPVGGPVGGFMEPVNKLAVFAPYLALLGVIGAVAVVFRKRPQN
jgi:hypothetical protein